jgi:hypothetical protein
MYVKLRMCKDERIVVNAVIDAIKTRGSVRNLLDKHVPESDIQAIMETGTFAPSGLNMLAAHSLGIGSYSAGLLW